MFRRGRRRGPRTTTTTASRSARPTSATARARCRTSKPCSTPPTSPSDVVQCALPINTGGAHWLLNSAVYWLNQWVTNGTAPPTATPLQIESTAPFAYAKDANGTALGGVRTPQVDAPIAVLGGPATRVPGPTCQFCRLFGTTVPFTPEQLAARYPSHDAFVQQWAQAAINGMNAGYLLKQDAYELFISAVLSDIGNPATP